MAKNRLRKRILGFITFRTLTYLFLAAVVGGSYYYFRYLGKDRVGVLVAAEDAISPEQRALIRFLEDRKNTEYRLVPVGELSQDPHRLDGLSMLWIQETDSSSLQTIVNPETLKPIENFVRSGGGLLLGLRAAELITDLGFEPGRPATVQETLVDEGYGRKKGLHAYSTHPVFSGLHGGSYFFFPKNDMSIEKTGFFGEEVPEKGKVAGVGWSYVFLDEDEKLMLEYSVDKGKVMTVGAFLHFSVPNYQRHELEILANNLVSYLCGRKLSEPASYWTFSQRDTYSVAIASRRETPRIPAPWNLPGDDRILQRDRGGDAYWDLAGRRLLVMGKEAGGIDEIWSHPFMALEDYRLGIRFPGEDSVHWLKEYPCSITVSPSWFERRYAIGTDTLTEVMAVHPDEPAAALHYSWTGRDSLEVFFDFMTRFRLMWPYSSHATRDLYYGYDEGSHAFVIHDESGEHVLVVGSTAPAGFHTIGPFTRVDYDRTDPHGIPADTFLVRGAFGTRLNARENRFDVVVVASSEKVSRGQALYRRLLADPGQVLTAALDHQEEMDELALRVRTPVKDLNLGYEWARIATDRLFVSTPGVGNSLVAGYGTTDRGWDGGQLVNGRPGYAWYFGRDAIWCAFAMLDYGDFDKVRMILETFNRFQSPDGKIYHELTTSGFVHYDAADATPLYVVLVGEYLRHSGDQAFVRRTWTHIKKAIDFCYSTDTDGDGLIENTNVGHGWVEGGALFGSKTTLYLASVWAEALRQAHYIARHMKYEEEASYLKDYERVLEVIRNDFKNPVGGFYAHGKYPDDTYNREPTIMPAIPMLFGQLAHGDTREMLRAYASNEFSTDWGTRIIGESSRNFNPRGYHTGSIWPLYTGWTSLAEYRYGNDIPAYNHLMANAVIYKNWGLGFTEEVLHGKTYTPQGVCAHQGWSETMVLQPLLEGMLGIEPDALEHRLSFSPAFPADWDHAEIRQIRTGNHEVDVIMDREPGRIRYQFMHRGPRALQLEFSPLLPGHTVITGISVDGEPVTAEPLNDNHHTQLSLSLRLRNRKVVEISHEGIYSVLPAVPDPQPGDSSSVFRILDQEFVPEGIRVLFEGKPEEEAGWKLYAEHEPGQPANARLVANEGNLYHYVIRFPETNRKYARLEVLIPFPASEEK